MLVHKDLFNQLLSLAVEGIEYSNSNEDDKEGEWITIRGTHVFIPKGENVVKVIYEKWSKDKEKAKKDKKNKNGWIGWDKDTSKEHTRPSKMQSEESKRTIGFAGWMNSKSSDIDSEEDKREL